MPRDLAKALDRVNLASLVFSSISKREQISLLAAVLFSVSEPSIVAVQATKIYISAPSKSLSWFPIDLAREKGI